MDRSVVGKEAPSFTFPVERGKIMEFARAIKEDNPIYFDKEAAKKAGFPDVIAPPTYSMVAMFTFEPPESHPNLGLSYSWDGKGGFVLHGEAEWQYFKALVAGDVMTVTSKCVDMYEKEGKRGGKMELAVTEATFVNQRGEKALVYRTTAIQQWTQAKK